SARQQHDLRAIAARTWSFYTDVDVDPVTSLPRDWVSDAPGVPPGNYTSATDIGVYLWSILAARDLRPRSPRHAPAPPGPPPTPTTLEALRTWNGFLLSWYDTGTAQPFESGTSGPTIPPDGSLDGQQISTVDNGWYAASLVIVRQAFPQLAARATRLLNAMDFGVFYAAAAQPTDITAGQMYGAYTVGTGPADFHYGLLNTETRIAAYVGIGTHRMPGDVWWRTWRTLPADFDWQTQPPQGQPVTYAD